MLRSVLPIWYRHYYTPAVIHGFMWRVVGSREIVSGRPVHEWAVLQCLKLVRANHLFDLRTADPKAHLFGECSHGVGHGSMAQTGSNTLCVDKNYDALWELDSVPQWANGERGGFGDHRFVQNFNTDTHSILVGDAVILGILALAGGGCVSCMGDWVALSR